MVLEMLRSAKKILVIDLGYIGDTIWMSPFIKNLKLNLPDADISALVNEGCEAFLKLIPELSEVISFKRKKMKGNWGAFRFIKFLKEIRNKKFDTVFVLSNLDRPTIIGFASGARIRIGFKTDNWWRGLLLTKRIRWDADRNPHMSEYNLQALTDIGLKIYERIPIVNVPDGAMEKIAEKFNILRTRNKKSIVVHPSARVRLRQWGVENFADVINSVSDYHRIFLIGGPHDTIIIQAILSKLKRPPDIVSTDLELLEFAALCKLSDLFVGNDSAPIHIAAAIGLFVIGIYGPALSEHCCPLTDKKTLFEGTAPCKPCKHNKCINQEERACLTIIKPEIIINKIKEVFEKSV
jgi:heptosyltransferase-3